MVAWTHPNSEAWNRGSTRLRKRGIGEPRNHGYAGARKEGNGLTARAESAFVEVMHRLISLPHTVGHLARFRGFRSPHYTQVPDELFDELLSTLSGAELKVVLYIIRRTFGFKKQRERISLSQIRTGITTRDGRVLDRGTGLSLSAAQSAIKGLVAKGIIHATRNRSAERGDEATTYELHLREREDALDSKDAGIREGQPVSTPVTGRGAHPTSPMPPVHSDTLTPVPDHRHGGLPIFGGGRYRQSVTQETVVQHTDVSARISRAARPLDEQGNGDGAAAGISTFSSTSSMPALIPSPMLSAPAACTGSLRPLADVLAQRHLPHLSHKAYPDAPASHAPTASPTASTDPTQPRPGPHRLPGQSGRIQPTPQIAVAIIEIAQAFGDQHHLAANCTQAMHVWEACGRGEDAFVSRLYEAYAITKQQPRVANRMSYFWIVVRDLLGLRTDPPHPRPPLLRSAGAEST